MEILLVETMHVWNAPGKGLFLRGMCGYQIFGIDTLELQRLSAFWLVFKQCGERNSAVDTVVSIRQSYGSGWSKENKIRKNYANISHVIVAVMYLKQILLDIKHKKALKYDSTIYKFILYYSKVYNIKFVLWYKVFLALNTLSLLLVDSAGCNEFSFNFFFACIDSSLVISSFLISLFVIFAFSFDLILLLYMIVI
jgi:hypothetical protein